MGGAFSASKNETLVPGVSVTREEVEKIVTDGIQSIKQNLSTLAAQQPSNTASIEKFKAELQGITTKVFNLQTQINRSNKQLLEEIGKEIKSAIDSALSLQTTSQKAALEKQVRNLTVRIADILQQKNAMEKQAVVETQSKLNVLSKNLRAEKNALQRQLNEKQTALSQALLERNAATKLVRNKAANADVRLQETTAALEQARQELETIRAQLTKKNQDFAQALNQAKAAAAANAAKRIQNAQLASARSSSLAQQHKGSPEESNRSFFGLFGGGGSRHTRKSHRKGRMTRRKH
jgi:chromosome segregation ATPase